MIKFKSLKYNIIVAHCNNFGIGYQNTIPWYIKKDMTFFKNITTGEQDYKNAVIGGYNTFQTLPKKYLHGRTNYCLTSKPTFNPNVYNFTSPDILEKHLSSMLYDNIWVIGAQQVDNYYLKHKYIDKLFITHIHNDYKCDKFFNSLDYNNFDLIKTKTEFENNILLEFKQYTNKTSFYNYNNFFTYKS